MADDLHKLGQEWVTKVTTADGPELSADGAALRALDRDAWLRRYAARFGAVAALTPEAAETCARAETFEVLSDGFEDDPEGAADMEMSYWDGD